MYCIHVKVPWHHLKQTFEAGAWGMCTVAHAPYLLNMLNYIEQLTIFELDVFVMVTNPKHAQRNKMQQL